MILVFRTCQALRFNPAFPCLHKLMRLKAEHLCLIEPTIGLWSAAIGWTADVALDFWMARVCPVGVLHRKRLWDSSQEVPVALSKATAEAHLIIANAWVASRH
mmetsp:Transcript_124745/g.216273  ORF Transcript_124745/g.216273 Transcript_124745/m.216273 type:complete len:103 (+) Transcript_124745:277-585(+)